MNSNGGSKSRPRTASTGKAANNGAGPYLIVSFLFVAMFLGLIAYLVYFNAVRKEEFLNSSYNTRQNNYAERVIRGTIYSADGQELAKTTTDENGDEVRTYPFGSLFAQVVGYTGKGNSGLESSYNYMLMESHTSKLKRCEEPGRQSLYNAEYNTPAGRGRCTGRIPRCSCRAGGKNGPCTCQCEQSGF